MTTQEAKAKVKRIVESNTTYTQIHQLADPKAEVNVKTLIEDLEDFVEKIMRK